MTPDQIVQYWPALLAAAVIALILFWVLARRGGQRVDLRMADDDVPAPTLVRTAMREPVIVGPDPIAGAIALAVNAPTGDPDDLRQIKGLGPRVAARLNELGITRFDQIAALTPADVTALDAQLGSFAGRIDRDRWIEQAAFLARGDVTAFEAAFGKLDGGVR